MESQRVGCAWALLHNHHCPSKSPLVHFITENLAVLHKRSFNCHLSLIVKECIKTWCFKRNGRLLKYSGPPDFLWGFRKNVGFVPLGHLAERGNTHLWLYSYFLGWRGVEDQSKTVLIQGLWPGASGAALRWFELNAEVCVHLFICKIGIRC